jgi:hypothetical protein
MRKTLYLLTFFILLAGCSPAPTPLASGIEGQVQIGPMCPVVQVGVPCPDRPYQAFLTILRSTGVKVARFQTNTDGTFHFALAPGEYILRPESPGVMPYANEQQFTVKAGEYTRLTVSYDSGIR